MIIQGLPRTVKQVIVPPIKCQGIKTKLVKFILSNISWNGKGRWIEPFLGSGAVLFNVQPERALLNDVNPHIIRLYQMIYDGSLSPEQVRLYLTTEGKKLLSNGEDHYYLIRECFNRTRNPLDFIFLNRSCFNGVMRFNSKGEFNVPFCRKPDRFRQSYITKIVNQISQVRRIMQGKEWVFFTGDWREVLSNVDVDDFVYLDPPYIGRHTDYYQEWSEDDAEDLARVVRNLPCGFALSMWKENKYRLNQHIEFYWNGLIERTFTHFYHVGSTENLRNSMEEALLIKHGYETVLIETTKSDKPIQLEFALHEQAG
ncbi:MAG: Dam family site-specific DNA-(adenine-N6)-methyltransferase [Chloracidobacterium sp.]|uniref:Site-specific DNA-methyltransferase (adenine-specific) n=1 Tax=Chloracidobacterium validum TaxID=2821543 RepID=A0ABX8B5M9_9BACT|nr:Dam family site-specific DNA-(adenine-N6)-methyltransferase [Chloracidobacterium validum]QUW02238.1 Dam family site-specific DNA-(adenine-N6)-methyltransferase [Chloracidobacterium validum]